LFVIDPKGVIHWSYVSPVGINPGADGILKALGSMVQNNKEPKIPEPNRVPSKERT
jgi:hypothetical protein